MKICLVVFVAILLVQVDARGTNLSETNNGIYIGIAAYGRGPSGLTNSEPIKPEDKLVWCPFCNNGTVEVNYPAPRYGIKIKMMGPDGKEVAKTRLGASFGTNFDNVRRFEDTIGVGRAGYNSYHTGVIVAQGKYDERDGAFSGPLLPAPGKLFVMDKPGIYNLEIQMLMFRVGNVSNQVVRQLVRLPPVVVKVEKPRE